jgi:hypothetical protein
MADGGQYGLGFVAKLDGTGKCLWSKSFGGTSGNNIGTGIGVDGSGHVLVTGNYTGLTNFGGGPVGQNNNTQLFLLALDQSGGFLWQKQFGNPNGYTSLALDASSNVILCGSVPQVPNLDFGGGTIPIHTPLFLAKFDPTGTLVWSQAAGQPDNSQGSTTCNSVTTDVSGNIVFGGAYGTPPNFGPGPLPTNPTGGQSAYVARYSSSGAFAFALGNSGGGYSIVHAVTTIDAAGDILLTGTFTQTLALTGTALTAVGTGDDAFVLQLTPAGGFTSSQSFGDTQTQYVQPLGLAVTPAGARVIAGGYGGAVDLGNGEFTASPDGSPFVARL